MNGMNEEQMLGIFALAGIDVERRWKMRNEYWNGHHDADNVSPWWLVQTKYGLIKIGWRKRVINIDWEAAAFRGIVTADEVTKDEAMVHAWTNAKAVEYLTEFRRLAEKSVIRSVDEFTAKYLPELHKERELRREEGRCVECGQALRPAWPPVQRA